MTTSSERAEEWIVLISDAIDGHDFPALNAFTSLLTHFREALAGAHAIRCTCLPTPDGRDPRCVELQGLADGRPATPDPAPAPLGAFRPNLAR